MDSAPCGGVVHAAESTEQGLVAGHLDVMQLESQAQKGVVLLQDEAECGIN